MSDDLQALEDWAGALLNRMEPKERRTLTQRLARELRRSQQQRIKAQQNPDGTAYAPRKKQLRSKAGRIRQRKMFTGLSKAKYLKASSNANGLSVGFVGRTAWIARVHQRGLRDSAAKGGPKIDYAQRQLLGLTKADLDLIRDGLLNHLGSV